jgi:hypothetical protein
MEAAMAKEGLKLTHIIGPGAGHNYEKGANLEVNKRINEFVAKGKPERPKELKFSTYSLRYNRCGWLVIDGLEKHWERADVEARIPSPRSAFVKTRNVAALTVEFPGPVEVVSLEIDDTKLTLPIKGKEPGLHPMHFRKAEGKWIPVPAAAPADAAPLAKVHGLQGPIDDAFMDSFVMVAPSGDASPWVKAEMKHAVDHWRNQFRGDAPVKKDSEITDADIANSNLILWGNPMSNSVLAKIAGRLPVKWSSDGIEFGGVKYPASHVPVMIFPNPLNPKKYVVLNSGFTFREYDYLNNARQAPKLPDYAIIDTSVPPNARFAGKVVRAGFFGERWELLKDDGK